MRLTGGVRPWLCPRVWLVPLLAAGVAAALLTRGSNERAFLTLNHLGFVTGDAVWADLTVLGDTLVALAIGLLLARRVPSLLWATVPLGILATVWSHALKRILNVARPAGVLGDAGVHVIGPVFHAHSFPSGHATTAFALAALCVLGFDMGAWAIVPVAIATLVGISRCAVGAHWPLDVAAGALGGWLSAVIGLRIASRLPVGRSPRVQWGLAVAFAGCALALATGYRTGYPQAIWLQRGVAIAALGAFAATLPPVKMLQRRFAGLSKQWPDAPRPESVRPARSLP